MSTLQSRNSHYQDCSREKQMGQSSSCLTEREIGTISSGTNLNNENTSVKSTSQYKGELKAFEINALSSLHHYLNPWLGPSPHPQIPFSWRKIHSHFEEVIHPKSKAQAVFTNNHLSSSHTYEHTCTYEHTHNSNAPPAPFSIPDWDSPSF